MAGGIAYSQLRASSTVALAGLESYTDGGLGANSIRVGTGAGLALGSGGVVIDPTGTVTFTTATHTFNAGASLNVIGSTFSGNEVPNADWVSSQIATGVSWGYPVLDQSQLDSSGDAIRQAIAVYFDGQPASTNNVILSDGTTVRNYSFDSGGDVTVAIGADEDESMDNLAAAITGDGSGDWDAVVVTGLSSINDGSGGSSAGRVLIIYRTVQLASQVDRIYGTWSTQANVQFVDFTGEDDYTKSASSTLPTADPTTKSFGPGKITSALKPGEAHVDLNNDSQYVWDADGGNWTQISGTGSIIAGAGLTKSGSTLNVNSGVGTLNGIVVGTDTIGVALGAGGGLKFSIHELFIEPNDFAGTGLEDDGADNLRLATQGNGIAGGAGSTLSVLGGTAGGDVVAATVTASGVGFDVSSITGTGLTTDGSGGLVITGSSDTFKEPVRAKTQGNIADTVAGAPNTVDGVALAVGNRILVADQTTPSQDGIYTVTTVGTGANGVWARSEDAPTGGEAAGWYIQVLEGTLSADTLYRVDADLGGATIGTDGWTLSTFSGADTTRSAGDGLTDGAGLDLDVLADVTTGGNILPVTVSANGVGVDISAITGTGIEADGSANLRLATQGNGIAGGGGSTLSVDPATPVGGSRAAVYVGADGVGIDLDDSTLTHSTSTLAVKAAGITETHLNTSVAGNGLAGGGGTALSVGVENGLAVSANAVGIDLTGANGSITYSGTVSHTYPVGVTAIGLFATGVPLDANHVVNKAYVDNLSTGLSWREPASVLEYIGTRTVAQINALTPDLGIATVAGDAGTPTAGTSDALVAGDIAEFNGTEWKKIVGQVGGFPPVGTRAVIAYPVADTLYSPLTDGVDEGKVAQWDGTSLTPALTTPDDGDAILIVGDGSVNENSAFVYDGSIPSGSWNQFSGAGSINAGSGLSKSGNTINILDTAVTHTNPTILVQTDSIEVKYEAAGVGTGGLTDVASGLRVLVASAGAGTGGLALAAGGVAVLANTAAGIELTASGVAVNLEANGVGEGGLAFDSGEIRISIDGTGGANLASVLKLTATGLSIGVDDVGIEETGAGGTLRLKDGGVVEAKLGTDAATITKINLRFREEVFGDTGWTVTGGEYQQSLAAVPLTDTRVDFYNQCLRNGVADMTNMGSASAATTLDEYRILDDSGGKIRIGGNPNTSGHQYRIRYVSTNS